MEKICEKKYITIAYNVLYAKKEKIYPAYVSKNKSNREKQGILLMIPNQKKLGIKSEGQWNYIAVKRLSALLRGITSKHHPDFYCLNCLHSFRTEDKLESHKKVCEDKDFCNIVTPSECTKI